MDKPDMGVEVGWRAAQKRDYCGKMGCVDGLHGCIVLNVLNM